MVPFRRHPDGTARFSRRVLRTLSRSRWLLFCVWFVCDLLSWQTPGALSPHPEDLS